MRAYYEENLNSKQTSFFSRVRKKIEEALDLDTTLLSLKMKEIDLLRGIQFVDDIKDTYGEDYPKSERMNIDQLIYVLYQDFLKQVKNGSHNHKIVAEFLLNGKWKYIDSLKTEKKLVGHQRHLQQININSFVFEDVEEFEDVYLDNMVYIDLSVKDSLINRGKILIYDIEPHLKGEIITIEDILVVRYLDFIDRIRHEGNSPKVMEAILINLGYINETLE